MIRIFLLLILLYPSVASALQVERGGVSLNMGGSFKALITTGKTLSGVDYWSGLGRWRLENDLRPSPSTLIKAIYDVEAITGTILETPEFTLAKERPDDALYDLSRNMVDNPDLLLRHSLYRLYLSLSGKGSILTIGRQRIAWGQARLWNPTDLFNPVSPLEIERGERMGVDAISLEYFLGPLSSIHLVYAPRKEEEKEAKGLRLRINLRGYDVSFMGGRFRGEEVVGLDFAGNIGNSGFRGEATYTDGKGRKDFPRLVLSWDYSFPSTLYILLEYLYNGGNLGRGGDLSKVSAFSGEIATRNRNLLSLMVTYDPTPLIRVGITAIYDMDGSSSFLNPAFTYNITTNVDLVLGAQLFSGGEDDDFGAFSNTYYSWVEWFF